MGRIQQFVQQSLLGSVGFPIEQEVQGRSLYFSEKRGSIIKTAITSCQATRFPRHWA